MEQITVTVSTKHFKGNDFCHQRSHLLQFGLDPSQVRRCPLEEALVDAGHKDAVVHFKTFDIGDLVYGIDIDAWNEDTVNTLVKRANEGEEVSRTLTFDRINEYN